MATAKETHNYEINEISQYLESGSESENESQDELEGESSSEAEQDSDCVSEGSTDVSDSERASSSSRLTHTSRSWQKATFHPRLFQFESKGCGINNLNASSLLDFFKLFFDQKLIQTIVDETNKFQVYSTNDNSLLLSHRAKWTATKSDEIFLFLATFMLMAHVKKYRIKDYWSTDYLISTPIFGDFMPRDRFLLLLKFLHFNDNANQSERDRLYKIRPIMGDLRKNLDVLWFHIETSVLMKA